MLPLSVCTERQITPQKSRHRLHSEAGQHNDRQTPIAGGYFWSSFALCIRTFTRKEPVPGCGAHRGRVMGARANGAYLGNVTECRLYIRQRHRCLGLSPWTLQHSVLLSCWLGCGSSQWGHLSPCMLKVAVWFGPFLACWFSVREPVDAGMGFVAPTPQHTLGTITHLFLGA